MAARPVGRTHRQHAARGVPGAQGRTAPARALRHGVKRLSSILRTQLHTDAAEFAPELLRVQSSPPRPLPRAVLAGGIALLSACLLWAALARLDIVAVAQGKLIPNSSLKIIQPAEAGIVREILVSEGESV